MAASLLCCVGGCLLHPLHAAGWGSLWKVQHRSLALARHGVDFWSWVCSEGSSQECLSLSFQLFLQRSQGQGRRLWLQSLKIASCLACASQVLSRRTWLLKVPQHLHSICLLPVVHPCLWLLETLVSCPASAFLPDSPPPAPALRVWSPARGIT